MCGEHQNASRLSHGPLGSSPHVRGALRPSATIGLGCGIIPACAGSTLFCHRFFGRFRDHPRMCGEHRICCQSCKISTGSSPHVRGALVQDFLQGLSTGIIPACAGSTVSWRIRRPPCRDHPRMCGEHNRGSSFGQSHKGSSPHVRGARAGRLCGVPRSGIIPACAGSTPSNTTPRATTRDHPRMCGEHADGNKTIQGAKGSSPHVRGALARRFASGSATGIIPACAGSTPMSPTGRGAMWDHPRMCGEHSRPMKSRSNCGGSSPHVRGARQSRSLINLSLGIIPACAGSTSETALHPW